MLRSVVNGFRFLKGAAVWWLLFFITFTTFYDYTYHKLVE